MEAPPLERKLVAILAGYSRLMGIDEEGTLSTLSAFRLVTDGLISQHGGRICGTAGDSILPAFGSALAAVQCAVDIQNELAHSNDALERRRGHRNPRRAVRGDRILGFDQEQYSGQRIRSLPRRRSRNIRQATS
jgi:adenylate cyclase